MPLTEEQINTLGRAIAKAILENLPPEMIEKALPPIPKEMRNRATSGDFEIARRVSDQTPVLVRVVVDDHPRRGQLVTRFYVEDRVVESEVPKAFLSQFGEDRNRYRWERDNGRLREAGYALCP